MALLLLAILIAPLPILLVLAGKGLIESPKPVPVRVTVIRPGIARR